MDTVREPKELDTINGKGRFDLYDNLTESGPKLVQFFREYLNRCRDAFRNSMLVA